MGHRVPFVAQMAAEDCGPACLAMILAWHGHHLPLGEVRDRCGAGRSGTTAFDLVMAAASFGLIGQGFGEVDPKDIPSRVRAGGPLIVHWGLNHMVVCEGATRRGLRILDPSLGAMEVTWDEADKKVSGVILVFRKSSEFQLRSRPETALASYLREIRASKQAMVAVVTAGLVAQALVVLPGLGVGLALAAGSATASRVAVAGIIGLALGSMLGSLLDLSRGMLSARVASLENERFYRKVLGKLPDLPIGWIQARGNAELSVRLMQTQRILGDAAAGLLTWITQASSAVACALLLVLISPLAAGYGLVAGLALVLLSSRTAERERIRKRPYLLATGRLGHEASEMLKVLPWFEMSGLVGWASEKLKRRSHGWRGHLVVAAEASQSAGFLIGSTAAVLDAGLLLLAGWEGVEGKLSLGGVAVLVAFGTLLRTSVMGIGDAVRAIRVAANTLDRASDILHAEGERRGEHAGVLSGRVEVQEASFSYWPGAEPVLRGISLQLQPGEMVGLVGSSGCGKSTLGALLAGVRLPVSGKVLLDGIETSDWEERVLRNQIGYALQDPEILAGSVRLNLAMGRDVTERALHEALEMACLDKVVGRLGGLGAEVAAAGRNLSGGERQRLALARVLVQPPALLILDEATSALDLALEREVHSNLRSLASTRVLITHRLGSLDLADRVIELGRDGISERRHV